MSLKVSGIVQQDRLPTKPNYRPIMSHENAYSSLAESRGAKNISTAATRNPLRPWGMTAA